MGLAFVCHIVRSTVSGKLIVPQPINGPDGDDNSEEPVGEVADMREYTEQCFESICNSVPDSVHYLLYFAAKIMQKG